MCGRAPDVEPCPTCLELEFHADAPDHRRNDGADVSEFPGSSDRAVLIVRSERCVRIRQVENLDGRRKSPAAAQHEVFGGSEVENAEPRIPLRAKRLERNRYR